MDLIRRLHRILDSVSSHLPLFIRRPVKAIWSPFRRFLIPKVTLEHGLIAFDQSKPTILLVCHEDSRTEVSMLCQKLAVHLKQEYNVVLLLLFRGYGSSIKNYFLQHVSFLLGPIKPNLYSSRVEYYVQRLAQSFKFKFSIVNSVESYLVLPFLAKCYIPTVTLIHEFPSLNKPRNKFDVVILFSTVNVFSAEKIKECFSDEFPEYKNYFAVLPQSFEKKPLITKSNTDFLAPVNHFDLDLYVKEVVKCGLDAIRILDQEIIDTNTIFHSGLCRMDYFLPSLPEISMREAVQYYIRMSSNWMIPRKLFPGFHQDIFKDLFPGYISGEDTLAQYIRADLPKGEWSIDVLTPYSELHPIPAALKVALHLHIYYVDLALSILTRLNQNKVRPDLFISVPSPAVFDEVQKLFDINYSGKVIEIAQVPNRGRDIGPLLTTFGNRLSLNYDIIGHIHTKKTENSHDKLLGENWFYFLLENLLGGRNNMADIILGKMMSDQTIGLVFPDDPHLTGWGPCRNHAEYLSKSMGIHSLSENIWFPNGTMFWARSDAILPLVNLHFGWEDYPVEPLDADGTMLHAIERIIPVVISHQGYRYILTNVAGVNR